MKSDAGERSSASKVRLFAFAGAPTCLVWARGRSLFQGRWHCVGSIGGAKAYPAQISNPNDVDRTRLRLGMPGSASVFADNAGVIGILMSILVWISSQHGVLVMLKPRLPGTSKEIQLATTRIVLQLLTQQLPFVTCGRNLVAGRLRGIADIGGTG